MAENPVGHVSAIAGAQHALPVFIYKPIMRFCVIQAFHQIFERRPSPVAVDRVNELLSVSGRAVKIYKYDYVSIGGKELEVPAIAPLVAHWNLRTAVNDEFHGIFLIGIEVRRLDEEAFDLVAVCA